MRRARQTFLPPPRERWERRQVTGQRVHGPEPLELQEECLGGQCVLHHVCAVQTVDAVGAEHARLCCSRRRVADLEEVPVCDGAHKHVKQKARGTTKEVDKPHLLVLVPEHRVHDRDLVVPVVPAVVVEVKVEVPHGWVVQQRDVATEHRRQCALLASGVDEIDDNHAAVLLHKRRKVVSEPKCLASRRHVVKAASSRERRWCTNRVGGLGKDDSGRQLVEALFPEERDRAAHLHKRRDDAVLALDRARLFREAAGRRGCVTGQTMICSVST